MPAPADFDHLYVASRRRLVLQAFALTGDLGAAGTSVRDAFIAARQHWRKVGRLEDPESWVRSRSWSIAQRRRVGRVWHREKDLADSQRQVLAALHALPDVQRKTLLLNHLAALTLPQIGREIGETRERAEQHLQQATSALAVALDCDSPSIRRRLDELEPVARRVTLPRATTVHRDGARRRRMHVVASAALAVLVALAAGVVVVGRPGTASTAASVVGTLADPGSGGSSAKATDGAASRSAGAPTPSAGSLGPALLLTADQLDRGTTGSHWTVRGTSDNLHGSGFQTACQEDRFADPHGVATLVRTFATTRGPRATAVQRIELSRDVPAAVRAYHTVIGWYAGCTRTRTQLLATYDVTGVGDAATALLLRLPGRHGKAYVVGVARSGAVTTSTVLQTRRRVPVRALGKELSLAVQNLCHTAGARGCAVARPALRPTLPPPSGDQPGMLAAVDLPFVSHLHQAWVGTSPSPARTNMAATPCDHSDFRRLGASQATTRTFLVPQARLPERFGLTETSGTFPGPDGATRAMHAVEQRLAKCSRADLGATVHHATVVGHSRGGSSYALWRVDVEIAPQRTVGYWMGVARVGRYLAQVTFSPVPGKDIDAATFRALVERARDRLLELP